MKFLNEFGKKTSETTSRIAREAKLKFKISESKSKITDYYEEIGKKVYEQHIREQTINIESDLEAEILEVDKLAEEIRVMREELLRLSQKKQCPRCNNEMDEGFNYCPRCGEKQNNDPTVFEMASDELEEVEIEPEDAEKAEIVKEQLLEEIEEELE